MTDFLKINWEEKVENSKISKFKNPYFWMGIVTVIFATANIDIEELTSWKLLWEAIIRIGNNPVVLFWIFGSILAMWNDNSTVGMDKIRLKKK